MKLLHNLKPGLKSLRWFLPHKLKMAVAVGVFAVIGLALFPSISEAVNGPLHLDSSRMPLEYRLYRVLNAIEIYVDGSQAYRNYLAADIANEAVHLGFSDSYGVEWNLLQYNHDQTKPAGFGKANVGIGQIGPNDIDDGFVNQWLEERGWTGFDLLEDDVKNMLTVDAYIVDYVVARLLKNNEPELYSRYECIDNARYCSQVWKDYEITTAIAGYRNGTDISPENHGYRISRWLQEERMTFGESGLKIHQPFELDENLVLVDEAYVNRKPLTTTQNVDRTLREYQEQQICTEYSLLRYGDSLTTDVRIRMSSLVLKIGEQEYFVNGSDGLPVFGPFTLANDSTHCFNVPYLQDQSDSTVVSLEMVYAFDTDEMIPGFNVYTVGLGTVGSIKQASNSSQPSGLVLSI